jgi:hypothetical protein
VSEQQNTAGPDLLEFLRNARGGIRPAVQPAESAGKPPQIDATCTVQREGEVGEHPRCRRQLHQKLPETVLQLHVRWGEFGDILLQLVHVDARRYEQDELQFQTARQVVDNSVGEGYFRGGSQICCGEVLACSKITQNGVESFGDAACRSSQGCPHRLNS